MVRGRAMNAHAATIPFPRTPRLPGVLDPVFPKWITEDGNHRNIAKGEKPNVSDPFSSYQLLQELRDGAKAALYDPELAAVLEARYPRPSLERLEQLAKADGKLSGDCLFQRIIDDIGNLRLPRYPETVNGCFIAGTLVHTREGMKPIEEIQAGDYVLSAPENGEGEKTYKRVLNTFAYDDKEIWVVKIRNWDPDALGIKNKQIRHIYCTGNHPFWVESEGWTAAEHLRHDRRLRLSDGGEGSVVYVWPVLRTPIPGVGWVPEDFLGSWDGMERAHIVDFRNGCNLWQYPIRHPEDAGVPYVGLICSEIGEIFDSYEMIEIFESKDRRFKTRVFNLDVEDFHTYCVGDLGVWVHNTNCYSLELLHPSIALGSESDVSPQIIYISI
jgi:hypothetical protein